MFRDQYATEIQTILSRYPADQKRAALGLPEYDALKFGRSGDTRMLQLEALPVDQRRDAIYGAPN